MADVRPKYNEAQLSTNQVLLVTNVLVGSDQHIERRGFRLV